MWFWCIFERYFFTLTVCTRVMVVNEFWTQRLTVLLFVTKVLGTCTCTWLKKYLMYLMPSKYCEYLYLYLYLQILKVLVLDSSTSKSTWPQPCFIYNNIQNVVCKMETIFLCTKVLYEKKDWRYRQGKYHTLHNPVLMKNMIWILMRFSIKMEDNKSISVQETSSAIMKYQRSLKMRTKSAWFIHCNPIK